MILLRKPDQLFAVDGPRPISTQIANDVPGSFLVDGDADTLWIGIYTKSGPGSIYELPISSYLLPQVKDQLPIDVSTSTDFRRVPRKTQGASFKGAALWASSSASTWGELKAGGAGIKTFGPGSEEIEFQGGCLWAVFEAGSVRWQAKSYPVVGRFDPGLITGQGDTPSCAPD